jgi:hypothetical protein
MSTAAVPSVMKPRAASRRSSSNSQTAAPTAAGTVPPAPVLMAGNSGSMSLELHVTVLCGADLAETATIGRTHVSDFRSTAVITVYV